MLKKDSCINKLFDLEHSRAKTLLLKYEYPWEALKDIKSFIVEIGSKLPLEEFDHPKEDVWIHKTAKIFPTAYIGGPCIIDADTEIRHCAFIRSSALIGKNCVVGNSTELKNVILFDNVQVPHYNYVGDAILGYKSHMGAGSVTSNVKSDKKMVKIHFEDETIDTGIKKIGGIIGDNVEIGCGSVINPGTVIGRNSRVYPLSSVRVCISENSIYKRQSEIVELIETL